MSAPTSLAARLWAQRLVWLPLVLVAVVLVGVFLLVPRDSAPFIYEFF